MAGEGRPTGFGMIPGIHHVTAIAREPQQNIDFYVEVLGLRLVKKTVNFDDPATYHLYYGDELGRPGTIMTFFPWPGAPRGSRGVGQVTVTGFSVPEGSLGFWRDRLAKANLSLDGPAARFDEEVLALLDPDGLKLELVAHSGAAKHQPWTSGPVPADHAIRGFHSVAIAEDGYEDTADLLTNGLGLRSLGESGNRFRFAFDGEDPGTIVDMLCLPGKPHGMIAVGTVHHVAWRVSSDGEQGELREKLVNRGLQVTAVLDRNYFRSIYFREPGGILFEIATDSPGFTVDERSENLGQNLKLPEWLEPRRGAIEERLPDVHLPGTGS